MTTESETRELLVAIDFGASQCKCLYSFTDRYDPKARFLDPRIVEIDIELDAGDDGEERENINDDLWVRARGRTYAFGVLARERFGGVVNLDPLKLETALYQTLALVGAIAVEERVESPRVRLAILLPYGEYRESGFVSDVLGELLVDFSFRGRKFSIGLTELTVHFEGTGLYALSARETGAAFSGEPTSVLMFGFRNTSILKFGRGTILKATTESNGFNALLEKISGYSGNKEDLIEAIRDSGVIERKKLEKLSSFKDREMRERDLNRLESKINEARKEYLEPLLYWLRHKIDTEVVIVGGGTAFVFAREIKETLKSNRLYWCKEERDRLTNLFGNDIKKKNYHYRLLDIYGIFLIEQKKLWKRKQKDLSYQPTA